MSILFVYAYGVLWFFVGVFNSDNTAMFFGHALMMIAIACYGVIKEIKKSKGGL